MSKPLVEKEFQEWLLHPITIALRLSWAAGKREDLRDAWEAGTFSAAFNTEMAIKNAGATGACSILREIQELDWNTFIQELNEHEYIRTETEGESGVDRAL